MAWTYYHPTHTGPQMVAYALADHLEAEQRDWQRLWPERAARMQDAIDDLNAISQGDDAETIAALRDENDAAEAWEESLYRCRA